MKLHRHRIDTPISLILMILIVSLLVNDTHVLDVWLDNFHGSWEHTLSNLATGDISVSLNGCPKENWDWAHWLVLSRRLSWLSSITGRLTDFPILGVMFGNMVGRLASSSSVETSSMLNISSDLSTPFYNTIITKQSTVTSLTKIKITNGKLTRYMYINCMIPKLSVWDTQDPTTFHSTKKINLAQIYLLIT